MSSPAVFHNLTSALICWRGFPKLDYRNHLKQQGLRGFRGREDTFSLAPSSGFSTFVLQQFCTPPCSQTILRTTSDFFAAMRTNPEICSNKRIRRATDYRGKEACDGGRQSVRTYPLARYLQTPARFGRLAHSRSIACV